MISPLKRAGFGHGIYQDSNSKKERVGTLRFTQDGRGFRYILAGASDLNKGKLTSSPAEADANLLDEDVASGQAAAIGDTLIYFTAGGATTLTLDELQGGMYVVNDATGEGQFRIIEGNPPSTGTDIVITIDEPLQVATVVSTTQHSIFLNPWSKVILQATIDFFPTGAPQCEISATNYGWSQTKGWGVAWYQEATAAGSRMVHGTTDGQVQIDDGYTEQVVAIGGPAVGVAAEYRPVYFVID